MSNTLPVLLPEHIDFAADKVDALVKSKNVFVEALDRPAAKLVLNYLNKVASPLLPDAYKPKIQDALGQVILANYAGAVEDAIATIEMVVADIENLKPGTKELVLALLSMVSAALVSLLEKKESQ